MNLKKGEGLPHGGSLSNMSTGKIAVPKEQVTAHKGERNELCRRNHEQADPVALPVSFQRRGARAGYEEQDSQGGQ